MGTFIVYASLGNKKKPSKLKNMEWNTGGFHMPVITMQELQEKCAVCRRCGLCEERTKVVFGVGDEHSRLLFIGEGPGRKRGFAGGTFCRACWQASG